MEGILRRGKVLGSMVVRCEKKEQEQIDLGTPDMGSMCLGIARVSTWLEQSPNKTWETRLPEWVRALLRWPLSDNPGKLIMIKPCVSSRNPECSMFSQLALC